MWRALTFPLRLLQVRRAPRVEALRGQLAEARVSDGVRRQGRLLLVTQREELLGTHERVGYVGGTHAEVVEVP